MGRIQDGLERWSDRLDWLRQNPLLDEGQFITFAKKRGIRVDGVSTGDPGRFHAEGWLAADGLDAQERLLFHPFRVYPLHRLTVALDNTLRISPSTTAEAASAVAARRVGDRPSQEQLAEATEQWNELVDLAILLEPLYWPRITLHTRMPGFGKEEEFYAELQAYADEVRELIRGLNEPGWRAKHEQLRLEAAFVDRNRELYLLLRLASWQRREKLEGNVSLALWLRHIAEVLRRAFEEIHDVVWPEEDQAFETWMIGGRTLSYGAERPLDNTAEARPYLVHNFGLRTGSIVRWYVEGDTEYGAIVAAIPRPQVYGIALINLKGQIAEGKPDAALKLRDWLEDDLQFKRFSMISFDRDEPNNVKAVRRQIQQARVVGSIEAANPDFEFHNFCLAELIEVAARLDEDCGLSGAPVREADWAGVKSGRELERRYVDVSGRRPAGLKGEVWGRALGAYALERRDRQDTGQERPFLQAVGKAVRGKFASYERQKDRYRFDPDTFESVAIPPDEAAR